MNQRPANLHRLQDCCSNDVDEGDDEDHDDDSDEDDDEEEKHGGF